MKDQYFGDINDYRKYGLLRLLCGGGPRLRLGVCWMLTGPDGSGDGKKLHYLSKPNKYREKDPELYDWMAKTVKPGNIRSTRCMEKSGLLGPDTRFFSDLVPKNVEDRDRYFDKVLARAKDLDLVFFDPDNGLEIKAVKPGYSKACKYIFGEEVKAVFGAGPSVLVYQHYPFIKRPVFHQKIVEAARERADAKSVLLFPAGHVLFVLLAQDKHKDRSRKCMDAWNDQWAGRLKAEEIKGQ